MNDLSEKYVIEEITPLSDKDCYYIADREKSEFTFPLHAHKEFELNYVENAKNVKRIVGDSVEIIGNYDLILITGEDLEHVWEQHECSSKKVREITIQFSKDLFFGNMLNKNQFSSIRKMFESARKGVSFPMETIMRVYPMLDNLSSEKSGFHSVIKLLAILYELSLCDKYRTLASTSFAHVDENPDSRRVQKIYNYINDHYKEEIRLEDLADIIGMTPVALSRFFKLRSGKTIIDYIIDIRLGHATKMLVETTNSIIEISYECGFNNLSNFNRVFKKRKRCTPTEFRKNFRRKKIII